MRKKSKTILNCIKQKDQIRTYFNKCDSQIKIIILNFENKVYFTFEMLRCLFRTKHIKLKCNTRIILNSKFKNSIINNHTLKR